MLFCTLLNKTELKMKKLLILLILPVISHTAVLENNITVRIGGVFNAGFTIPNDITATEDYIREFETLGGGYVAEVGYLWLLRGESTIQAIDVRLGGGQSFGAATKAFGASIPTDPYSLNTYITGVYIGATHTIGTAAGPGIYMMDTLGFNLGWLGATVRCSVSSDGKATEKSIDYGNSFLFAVKLPLGMQYIFDNGISVGFRHRLDFAFGSESGSHFGTGRYQNLHIIYNLTLSAGFTFGIEPPRGKAKAWLVF